jgi:hypothetical protein
VRDRLAGALLGALMAVGVAVVERRLRKALGKGGRRKT